MQTRVPLLLCSNYAHCVLQPAKADCHMPAHVMHLLVSHACTQMLYSWNLSCTCCFMHMLQDFAEAEHAHERFLHALVTQSFLSHTSLVRQLGQVFEQTSALCRLVKGARERGIDWAQVQVGSAEDPLLPNVCTG